MRSFTALARPYWPAIEITLFSFASSSSASDQSKKAQGKPQKDATQLSAREDTAFEMVRKDGGHRKADLVRSAARVLVAKGHRSLKLTESANSLAQISKLRSLFADL